MIRRIYNPSTGDTYAQSAYADGAFWIKSSQTELSYNSLSADTTSTGTLVKQDLIAFNASKSSSVYGNSTTAQPAAYYINIWKRTE